MERKTYSSNYHGEGKRAKPKRRKKAVQQKWYRNPRTATAKAASNQWHGVLLNEIRFSIAT
ncbi:hypothetical protein [Lysinibacillus boronitolerans]|uniref:hypothetical protein n=1 Tax=Lysinibacillus boronitolerans TaxID=309788 RepID=UPI0002F14A93|nr:hypothetical protein [Lysinibacillus boronitolerans]